MLGHISLWKLIISRQWIADSRLRHAPIKWNSNFRPLPDSGENYYRRPSRVVSIIIPLIEFPSEFRIDLCVSLLVHVVYCITRYLYLIVHCFPRNVAKYRQRNSFGIFGTEAIPMLLTSISEVL